MDILPSHRRPEIQGAREIQVQGQSDGISIDMLSDDILLEIFDAYRICGSNFCDCLVWPWDILVHVCRRWRQIILTSPLRLHLHLHCTDRTPVRQYLSFWPTVPLSVRYYTRDDSHDIRPDDEDNVLAALEHSDRVGLLYLYITAPQLEKLATVIQKPFPVLKKLQLSKKSWPKLVLPSGFLGGSVSCLQELKLDGVDFPELPMLLLSARNLVTLRLFEIPLAGYISPEVMVACLAQLTRLTSLSIGLESPTESLDQLDPASVTQTRTILPSLIFIKFSCDCGYVEDLVARIDCPRLKRIDLGLEDSYVLHPSLHLAQVVKFINRSEDPRITQFGSVDVRVDVTCITFNFFEKNPHHISIFLLLSGDGWGNLHMFQVFSQFSTFLPNVRHLDVDSMRRCQDVSVTNSDWVQVLVSFSALRTLRIIGNQAGLVALALEDGDGEMVAGSLPALELLCMEGKTVPSVARFCAVFRLSGRPVTLAKTRAEFCKRLKLYA